VRYISVSRSKEIFMRINYVLPLLMGIAFLIFGMVLPTLMPTMSDEWKYGLLTVGVVLLLISCLLARFGPTAPSSYGGSGGNGIATGEDSDAIGGAGGKANGGIGGKGGDARATGKGARAKGGAGGSG
jgi:hypothetical protein